MGYTSNMSRAPRTHNAVPKRVRKDSSSESNTRGIVEVSKKELVTVSLTTMPPTTNSLYHGFGARKHVAPKARIAKDAMSWEARSQYRGSPLVAELRVLVALRWGSRRNHDVDNIKSLLDSMTGILWEDDGQIVDLRITKVYEKGNEGLTLTVWHT